MSNFRVRFKSFASVQFVADHTGQGRPFTIECDDLDFTVEMVQGDEVKTMLESTGQCRRGRLVFETKAYDLENKTHRLKVEIVK